MSSNSPKDDSVKNDPVTGLIKRKCSSMIELSELAEINEFHDAICELSPTPNGSVNAGSDSNQNADWFISEDDPDEQFRYPQSSLRKPGSTLATGKMGDTSLSPLEFVSTIGKCDPIKKLEALSEEKRKKSQVKMPPEESSTVNSSTVPVIGICDPIKKLEALSEEKRKKSQAKTLLKVPPTPAVPVIAMCESMKKLEALSEANRKLSEKESQLKTLTEGTANNFSTPTSISKNDDEAQQSPSKKPSVTMNVVSKSNKQDLIKPATLLRASTAPHLPLKSALKKSPSYPTSNSAQHGQNAEFTSTMTKSPSYPNSNPSLPVMESPSSGATSQVQFEASVEKSSPQASINLTSNGQSSMKYSRSMPNFGTIPQIPKIEISQSDGNIKESGDGLTSEETSTRNVSFSNLHIREYSVTLGDNPSCSYCLPLSLGWDYEDTYVLDVENFERRREPRRKRSQMVVSYYVRKHLIETSGCSKAQVKEMVKLVKRTKKQRQKTNSYSGTSKLEEAFESVGRKLKRAMGST